LNLIKRNAKGALNLERNIAIDETLVKFKGRVSFRQFLPNKPGRFGVKNFTLSESSSGYVWAGIHISFFFKLVNRASTSEKILALPKFYLPVQNYVIIKIQSKT